MSELHNESSTSLYDRTKSKESCNLPTTTKPEILDKTGLVIIKDELENKAEMNINLDLIPDSTLDTIQVDDFKFKILKELYHDTNKDYKLIKVNIILPKGSTYTFSPEKNYEQDHVKDNDNQKFKPENFSLLTDSFVSFANSIIDMGSTDFTAARFTSSSPIPELDEGEDENQSSFNHLPHVDDNVVKETLNNTTNISLEKDTKLIQFIKNTSTDTLNLSLTEQRSCISLPESRQSVSTELSDKISKSPVDSCTYYDDLKKWNCYDRNLKNENYSKTNCEAMQPFSITNSIVDKQVPDVCKALANFTVNIPPIMGKNALLAKSNITKHQKDTMNGKTDSEIIEEIVKDKFQEFLTEYNNRSIKRKAKKQGKMSESEKNDDDLERVCNTDKQQEIAFENQKTENQCTDDNTLLIIPEIKIIPNSIATSNVQINQTAELIQCNECLIPERSSSKLNIPTDFQMLSAASSVTTCASRDFGEFIESGLFDSEFLLSDEIEYDSQKFLEAALGENIDQGATLYDEPFDVSSFRLFLILFMNNR